MLRPIWWLALPVMCEEMLMVSVGWTDWWLTCQFLEGTDPRAAMGLMSYVMWLIPSLFAAVAIGATAMVARFVGAGQRSQARRVANQAVLAGTAAAVLAAIVTWMIAPHFGTWLQLPPPAARYATTYIQIVSFSIPFIMMEQVGAACLRGAGDTVTGLVAKIAVVIVNILVSASLVQGLGPLPELGWPGLAIGTACGHAVGGTLISLRLIMGGAGLKLSLRWMRPNYDLLLRLLRIGTPGGVDMLALLTCQFIFVGIINRLGSAAGAAHGLALQIESLAYLPGSAFQVAAATVAGQFLGAGKPGRATHGTLLCVMMGGSIMTFAGTVFFFFGRNLTALFTGDWNDPTGIETAQLLRIVAFSMPALAIVMIITGALRGAGDTKWPLINTLVGFVVIRIPLACWMAWDEVSIPALNFSIEGCGWGVIGAWYAMMIDLFLRSLFVGLRFAHGGWRKARV